MRKHGGNSELGFLLACCAQVPETERQERMLRALVTPLDWDRIVAKAELHGVIPQVYRAVAAASTTLPEILLSAYIANCQRTLWFATELVRVTKHLQDRGIE